MSKSYLRTDGRTTHNYSLEPHKNQMKNKIDTQSNTQKLKIFFWYFEISYSKFARDLTNTQTLN
jgi:hypothetical protein